MRRGRSDLIRVGIFVVVAGSLLVGGLLWIAGARVFRPVSTYTVLFETSVSGLNAGANVEYQGVVVGRVRDIRLTGDIPPKVAVVVDLEPQTPVRTDTTAALLGSLVTGIKFIQLQGGTSVAPPLAPGGTIRGSAASLEAFRDRLEQITERVDNILRTLEETVFTPENSVKLARFLDDLGSVTGSLNRTLGAFKAEETGRTFAEFVDRVTKVAADADAVLSDFYRRREALYGGIDSTIRDLGATAREAHELVRSTRQEVGTTSGSLGALVAELTNATNRLQETLDVINSNPSILLWGRDVPEREYRK